MLVIGPSGSGKTNALPSLIQKGNGNHIDNIYLYMDDVYNKIDDYNPKRKRKILIVFDDMIADIMTNKRYPAIIKELFIRCSKLNVSLVFITHS